MFSKSNLLATLVAGVFLFFGGYVIWGILMVDFFAEHAGTATGVMKEEVDMFHIALGSLIQAFFMGTIYSKWSQGVHNAKNGFQFGALVGAFMGIGIGLLWFATSNLNDFTGTTVEAILEIIFFGIAGAIIGMVYKATNK